MTFGLSRDRGLRLASLFSPAALVAFLAGPASLPAQDVTVVRAARMLDVAAGRMVSPAVVTVKGDRIVSVGGTPAAGARVMDPRRRHPAARTDRPAYPSDGRAIGGLGGRRRAGHAGRLGAAWGEERPDHAARRVHHRARRRGRRVRGHRAGPGDRRRLHPRTPGRRLGPRDRDHRRTLRPDRVGAGCRRAGARERRGRRARRGHPRGALPDQARRQGHQALRHGRGAVVRRVGRRPADGRRRAARGGARGRAARDPGGGPRAWGGGHSRRGARRGHLDRARQSS